MGSVNVLTAISSIDFFERYIHFYHLYKLGTLPNTSMRKMYPSNASSIGNRSAFE